MNEYNDTEYDLNQADDEEANKFGFESMDALNKHCDAAERDADSCAIDW